jgi:hypothetical protein
MGTRFIHKDGRIIPIHTDHGDQPQSQGEHAAPINPPANPSPVAGHEDKPHPEPRKAEFSAQGGSATKTAETPAPGAPAAPKSSFAERMKVARESKKKGLGSTSC